MPLRGGTGITAINGYIDTVQLGEGYKVRVGDSVEKIYGDVLAPAGFPRMTFSELTDVQLNGKVEASTSFIVYKDDDNKLYAVSNIGQEYIITTNIVGDFCVTTDNPNTVVVFADLTLNKVCMARFSSGNNITLYTLDIAADINTFIRDVGGPVSDKCFVVETQTTKKIYKYSYNTNTLISIDINYDSIYFSPIINSTAMQVVYTLSGVLYSKILDKYLSTIEDLTITIANENVVYFAGLNISPGFGSGGADAVVYVNSLGVMKLAFNADGLKTYVLDSSIYPFNFSCSLEDKRLFVKYFDADGFNIDVYSLKSTLEPFQVYNLNEKINMDNVTYYYIDKYKTCCYVESGVVKSIRFTLTTSFTKRSAISLSNGNSGDMIDVMVLV